MANFLTSIFGSRNQRILKKLSKKVSEINNFESDIKTLSDEALRSKTNEFRERLKTGETLDDLLVEAFAVVRETSVRTLGMRPFDVQLIGGMVLHQGDIAEMRTGEGKTLVATLPAYLNALSDKGVHVVTVNEYLAKRDSEWMSPIYEFLELTVGVTSSNQSHEEKKLAYEADITYTTNNELGFDYLRDNLAFSSKDKVQRELNFAIVDEVDSILIDEARTPLIISGPVDENIDLYQKINKLIPKLKSETEEDEGDYTKDEKSKQIFITESGHQHIEELMINAGLIQENESLYDAGNIRLLHHLNAALRAHAMFNKDVDYIVKEGEVVIVDEFTGRTMPGRRWSDGLHQAVEAKENVSVKQENQTVASITFQNYFRLYENLSGMTGTADTEAYEFQSIYGLEVIVIPTHKPMIRNDFSDLVYLNEEGKFNAIIKDIIDCREKGQPTLVGTTSIETSELLSNKLKKMNIKHEVLNAKQHEREAVIVQQAGKPGAITIATNMAGRGTDIVLGGNLEAELESSNQSPDDITENWKQRQKEVIEAGGLHIIGTERHESRRIDNQLRGRSGRQGDAGSSRFYLSMEDNLMRIFGDPDRTKSLLSRAGMQEGEAIESKLLSRQIEKAQRKVESHNFDIRKNLLEYDDVSNDQRKVVYHQRNELMSADDVRDSIKSIREEVVEMTVDQFIPAESHEEDWDPEGLMNALEKDFLLPLKIPQWIKQDSQLNTEMIRDRCIEKIELASQEKEEAVGADLMRMVEKEIMLKQLDLHWKEHLAAMDYLRQGIGLRGYAQKNPKQEYKQEAFLMFSEMLDQVKHDTISTLARIRIQSEQDIARMEEQRRSEQSKDINQLSKINSFNDEKEDNESKMSASTFVRKDKKIGRNDPCPCGSGKKYKQCCGKIN
ncbi:MAG: preprotein translocase subunit SecA [Gammaproteobacteria bacterium]|nr:MAG: preprotein translocase subunit SecA [Gammaproteobacteria bacterium]|tara:strand:+ start:3608 stop:6298 length:2691 start_codon:yes stop_codon:yes gene_type:complete